MLKQWWSSFPPISTNLIITTHYNSLKMILVWDWYKNVAVNIFCNIYYIWSETNQLHVHIQIEIYLRTVLFYLTFFLKLCLLNKTHTTKNLIHSIYTPSISMIKIAFHLFFKDMWWSLGYGMQICSHNTIVQMLHSTVFVHQWIETNITTWLTLRISVYCFIRNVWRYQRVIRSCKSEK